MRITSSNPLLFWSSLTEPTMFGTDVTLRDLFAAHAMQAMVGANVNWATIPEDAYEMADALLARREETG